MSRVGRVPIKIPQDLNIKFIKNELTITGPKGELKLAIHPKIKVVVGDKQIVVEKKINSKLAKSLHGLTQRLISNMIIGVTKGFEKKLEIKGVGYRVEIQADKLILSLGYSHPVELKIPPKMEIKVQKNIICVSGIDKQQIGQFAAQIRATRKPEPYKGKGIRYLDEVIKLKPGKAAKTTATSAGE